jgi:8-oxo-dGTP diphosphatase
MSDPASPSTAPRVGVYALIGQDDRLLLLEHPEHDVLPGGAVRAAQPVEKALRTTLRHQLGARIAELDFCAVVEHDASEPGQPPAFEVAFLFDVTLTNHDLRVARPYRWATEHELSPLRPQAIRDALIAGIPADNPWRAWTP